MNNKEKSLKENSLKKKLLTEFLKDKSNLEARNNFVSLYIHPQIKTGTQSIKYTNEKCQKFLLNIIRKFKRYSRVLEYEYLQ